MQPGYMCTELIPDAFQDRAEEKLLRERDVVGFLLLTSNEYSVELVYGCAGVLASEGLLEEAFVHAVTATRTNNRDAYEWIEGLIPMLDKASVRAVGDPFPGTGPWTLYRGVGGQGAARRVRGYSWTPNLLTAKWFADRAGWFGLEDPGVYRAVVPARHVLFFSDERGEADFFVVLPKDHPVERIRAPELVELAEELEG